MAKITLTDLANLTNENSATSTINTNNATLEVALEKTLSRDGTSPNQMGADFDMNSFRILNLPAPVSADEPLRLADFSSLTGSGTVSNIPKAGNTGDVFAKLSGTDYDFAWVSDTSLVTAGTNIVKSGTSPVTIATSLTPAFTTVNGLTLSTSTGTITLTNAKVLTVSNTLTFSGTDSASVNFAAGGTVAYVGTGLQQFASTTSAQLAGVLSDETGSASGGLVVFNNGPTLIAPVLGAATATTINKVTITQPAASATLTIANTKGLTVSNTLTLAGTDSTTITFQGTDTYVGRATTDTLTNKTISGGSNTLTNIANASLTNSTITIGSTSTALGGTLSAATGRGPNALNIDQATGHGDSIYTILATDRHVFTNATFTASRTWTLPAANAVNAGQRILIGDLQGTVTATNTLVIAAAGADTINGIASIALSSASTSLEVVSDGTSKWYAVQSGSGGGGAGGSTLAKPYEFVATAAQTAFTGVDQNGKTLIYTIGNIEVFVNGLRLNNSDYTAANGGTVNLLLGANVGDLVTIVDFGSGTGASSFASYEYTSTAGQTTFSGVDLNSKTLAYTAGFVLVYVNGDLLNTADYTASNGTSVVFAVGRTLNDQIKIISMNQASVGLIPSNNLSDVLSTTTARQNLGMPNLLRGYLQGLTLSTAGASTTFGIAAGVANDSTFTDFMLLSSAFTKTTSAWAVGTGNGAMDTGAIAINTWYHVHLIKRVDTGLVDVLISLSATAPTLPSGYTLSRRIGTMRTNASSQWSLFTQVGDEFLWSVSVADVFATNPGTAAVTRTLSVPTGVVVTARFNAAATTPGATNEDTRITITSLDQSDEAVATGTATSGLFTSATIGTSQAAATMNVRTNTLAQVRSRLLFSDASTTLSLQTFGWIDTRGRI